MAPVPQSSTANLPAEAQRFGPAFHADEAKLREIVSAFRAEFARGPFRSSLLPFSLSLLRRTKGALTLSFFSPLLCPPARSGLATYGQDVAMIPSYITGVPDGSEQGCVSVSFDARSCRRARRRHPPPPPPPFLSSRVQPFSLFPTHA